MSEVKLEWDDTLPKQYFDTAKEATYKVAKKVEGTAKRLAPVKTGNLKKRITAGRTKKPITMSFVYANAPHSHLIEYGHQVVRGGRVVGHAPARPYLRPALEANSRSGTAIVEKELRKVATKSGK